MTISIKRTAVAMSDRSSAAIGPFGSRTAQWQPPRRKAEHKGSSRKIRFKLARFPRISIINGCAGCGAGIASVFPRAASGFQLQWRTLSR